jgi:intein-encoded DNA endonuclease-like protein
VAEVASLHTQLEEMGESLSKINSRYQRQFERYEADQQGNLEALKREHTEALEQLTKQVGGVGADVDGRWCRGSLSARVGGR